MKHILSILGATCILVTTATAAADIGLGVYVPSSQSKRVPIAGALYLNTPANDPNLTPFSYAAASADLTAGTLRGSTISHSQPSATMVGETQSSVNLIDTITIAGTPGQIDVIVSLDVDGVFTDKSIPLGGTIGEEVDISVGIMAVTASDVTGTRAALVRSVDATGKENIAVNTTMGNPADVVTTTLGKNPKLKVSVTGKYNIGDQLNVQGNLFITNGTQGPDTEAWADFGNTARFSITLPAGYTFTSASGQLLTRAGADGLSLDGGSGGPEGGATTAPDGGTVTGQDGGGSGGGTGGGVGGGGGDTADGGDSSANAGSGAKGGCTSTGADAGVASSIFAAAISVAALLRRARKRGAKATS